MSTWPVDRKRLFGDLCDHINRKYILETISVKEVAIRCFDLKDVGFIMVYDVSLGSDGISNKLVEGTRPAVSITGLGIEYARIVLKPRE